MSTDVFFTVEELANPPATHVKEYRKDATMGLIGAFIFGGIGSALIVLACLGAYFEREPVMLLTSLMGMFFLVPSIFIFRAARSEWGASREITIDGNHVVWRETAARKPVDWTEPLENYEGVMGTLGRAQHGRPIIGTLVLKHEDPKKTIQLWRQSLGLNLDSTEGEERFGVRATWNAYARALNVPLLVKDGEDLLVRQPEDLGKSLQQLAREGKLETSFNIPAPAFGSITVVDGAAGKKIIINRGGMEYHVTVDAENAQSVMMYGGKSYHDWILPTAEIEALTRVTDAHVLSLVVETGRMRRIVAWDLPPAEIAYLRYLLEHLIATAPAE